MILVIGSSQESGLEQWAYQDLNLGPLPYQGSALTELSYTPSTAMNVTVRSRAGTNRLSPATCT